MIEKNITPETDLIERVAEELYTDAIEDIKELLRISGFETTEPKYGDLDNNMIDKLRSKAVKLIAMIQRESGAGILIDETVVVDSKIALNTLGEVSDDEVPYDPTRLTVMVKGNALCDAGLLMLCDQQEITGTATRVQLVDYDLVISVTRRKPMRTDAEIVRAIHDIVMAIQACMIKGIGD